MRSLPKFAGAVLAFGLIAAACGDDDSDAADSTPATTAAPAEADADAGATEETGTVVDVAVAAGDFTTLVAAVGEAGLVDTLSGDGPFTVLAPNDAAFADALDALGVTAEELLADPGLGDILTYHVIPSQALAADVISLDGQQVETVNGAVLDIAVVDGGVTINGVNVIATDILASNGVIHVLDAVLLPPA